MFRFRLIPSANVCRFGPSSGYSKCYQIPARAVDSVGVHLLSDNGLFPGLEPRASEAQIHQRVSGELDTDVLPIFCESRV